MLPGSKCQGIFILHFYLQTVWNMFKMQNQFMQITISWEHTVATNNKYILRKMCLFQNFWNLKFDVLCKIVLHFLL